jgi:hypothetical protein
MRFVKIALVTAVAALFFSTATTAKADIDIPTCFPCER